MTDPLPSHDPPRLSLRRELWNTLLVARPGLWATQLWFYLLPLGGRRVLDEWTFWLGAVYVMFPLAYLLYGWNDLADHQTDRLNPRKGNLLFGARLPRRELRKLPLRIAAVQAPFWALMLLAVGPKFLLWVAVCLAVNAAYNTLGLKGLPVLDVLNQAGYLLVFVLSSWLNDAPQLGWPALVFGALFAMHAHLLNEITDIEPDRLAGRRTTAVAIGVRRTKLVVAALLAAEAAIMTAWFDSRLVAGFLAAAAAGFFADFLFRGERVLSDRALKWVLIAWNVVAVASMHWVWREALFVSG
ncbi:prenyltransferase [Pirellulimonas nuda]|uniref:Prenyltransferase n=1 Tax=Pirellulimonas nuda TaxID=2528009 RepID=A0A518D791_9BACT|nr:UbiA family prenyltransferase [Pirellulimonas nuda]QDU87352.1 prenyltransferase [Pirellulimonas nuda]